MIEILKFMSDSCFPCKALSATIDKWEHKNLVRTIKTDTDEGFNEAVENNVKGNPTLIFKKDGKEIMRLVGNVPLSSIEKSYREVSGIL